MAGLAILMLFALGGLLGVVLIVLSRAGGRGTGYPACGSCGYDVTGTLKTNVDRCPECGSSLAEVGVRPPGRQPGRTPMLVLGIVLVVVMLTCVGGVFFSLFAVSTTRTVAPVPAATANSGTPADTADVPLDTASPERESQAPSEVGGASADQ